MQRNNMKKIDEKKQLINIFKLPIRESKFKFLEMNTYVKNIIGSDKFIELTTKTKIPLNATRKDVEEMVKKYAPEKVSQFIEFLFDTNFEDIMHIGALIFCQDYELYISKSINQILDDFKTLSKDEVGQLVGFFHRAGL